MSCPLLRNGFARAAAALALFSLCALSPASAQLLWYNGNFDGRNGLANEENTAFAQSAIYDDFIVPAGQTWNITSVFSDNLESVTTLSAHWEIRSGVSL